MDPFIQILTLKAPREELVFVKAILEGYDNLAIMTTLDPHEGLFEIRVSSRALSTICSMLETLFEKNELSFLAIK